MKKKYNYQEFKKDPRTYTPTGKLPRSLSALFKCIDNKKTSSEDIFTAIDEEYSTGKHRCQSYIKDRKIRALKLLSKFIF